MADTQNSGSPNATHTLVILAIVIMIIGVPWLLGGSGGISDPDPDSILGSQDPENPVVSLGLLLFSPQLLVMLLPLGLILAVRLLATETAATWMGFEPDASTIHHVTGSSVGVAAIVVLVLLMVTFQSFFLNGDLF